VLFYTQILCLGIYARFTFVSSIFLSRCLRHGGNHESSSKCGYGSEGAIDEAYAVVLHQVQKQDAHSEVASPVGGHCHRSSLQSRKERGSEDENTCTHTYN